jgi:hypothetical protein
MTEVALDEIKSFRHLTESEPESNSEPVFVLTSSQLEEIITRAVQPLRDEVDQLRDTITTQAEKITALEATQDTQADNQLIQLKLINDLREKPQPEPTKTVKDHVEDLYRLMAEDKTTKANEQLSIAKAAGLLGISRQYMQQAIKPLIRADGRFTVFKDKVGVKGQTGYKIKIRKYFN